MVYQELIQTFLQNCFDLAHEKCQKMSEFQTCNLCCQIQEFQEKYCIQMETSIFSYQQAKYIFYFWLIDPKLLLHIKHCNVIYYESKMPNFINGRWELRMESLLQKKIRFLAPWSMLITLWVNFCIEKWLIMLFVYRYLCLKCKTLTRKGYMQKLQSFGIIMTIFRHFGQYSELWVVR